MSKILIVDDSPVDRMLVSKLLGKRTDWTILQATDGQEALNSIEREAPNVVVTDLQMPGMNGLELVTEMQIRHPQIPVMLITAHGSEDLAVQALHGGAASYVPKRNLSRDLIEAVEVVLEAAQGRLIRNRLMESLTRTESRFTLENDPSLIPPLIGYLKDNLLRVCGPDDSNVVRVTIALREAILNAMDHGNLELDSALREQDEKSYHLLGNERRKMKPYGDRRVFLISTETPQEAIYVIRDEGPGFDPSKLPDPTDPSNLEMRSGRGLLLIRTFMTEVHHNERGNEVTLIRRLGG